MPSNRQKKALDAVPESLHSPSPGRSSFHRTEDSIDRLTAVMTNSLERDVERERPSSFIVRGDVIPEFNPENKNLMVTAWCNKVDELRDIYKWSEEITIYFAMSKLKGLPSCGTKAFQP